MRYYKKNRAKQNKTMECTFQLRSVLSCQKEWDGQRKKDEKVNIHKNQKITVIFLIICSYTSNIYTRKWLWNHPWIFLFQNLFHHTASHDAVQIKWSLCHPDDPSVVDLVVQLMGRFQVFHANG